MLAVYCSTQTLYLIASENPLLQLPGGIRPLTTCGFFGDAAVAMPADDHSLMIYNFDGSLKKRITGSTEIISAYDQSSSGKYCATGSYDNVLFQYDVATGNPAYNAQHNDIISMVRFSHDERVLCSLSWDNQIIGRSTTSNGPINYSLKPQNTVITVAPSPTGENLAVSFLKSNQAELWKIGQYHDHEVYATLTGHQQDVYALDWNPLGTTVATGSADGTVKIWDSGTGGAISTLQDITGKRAPLRYSHNGNLLAIGSPVDPSIIIYDMRTLRILAALAGHLGGTDDIKWSLDDTKIVSCSDREKTVKLWSVTQPVNRYARLTQFVKKCRRLLTPCLSADESLEIEPLFLSI